MKEEQREFSCISELMYNIKCSAEPNLLRSYFKILYPFKVNLMCVMRETILDCNEYCVSYNNKAVLKLCCKNLANQLHKHHQRNQIWNMIIVILQLFRSVLPAELAKSYGLLQTHDIRIPHTLWVLLSILLSPQVFCQSL